MLRSPWFWVVVLLIAVGVALTAALGVLYWLIGTLVAALLTLVVVFLVAAYAVGSPDRLEVPDLREVPAAERISVIYDCDPTMGWPFRNVGDGLALLYLLGEPRVDLRLITTTYGDGPVWMTTRTTRRLLDRLGLGDVTVVRGAGSASDDPEANQAARRLQETVSAHPNEIVLLATGALTNLKHAAMLDPDFFAKLRGLSLLGGVTGPLVWNERRLMERNFSLDPEAAYHALQGDCPIVVTTGQAGLTAVFRGPQFAALQALDGPALNLVARKTRFWFALTRLWFRDDGFAMWESIAALGITHPEVLDFEQVHLPITIDDLCAGRLVTDPDQGGPVRLVRGVKDYERFIATHFAAWRRLGEKMV